MEQTLGQLGETRTLISGGINWNWYLCARFNDAELTVHIYWHDRFHKFDNPNHPVVTDGGTYTFMEDEQRNAYGLQISKNGGTLVEYLITNPGYVFGYNDFAQKGVA